MAQKDDNQRRNGKTFDPNRPTVQKRWLGLVKSAFQIQLFFESHERESPVGVFDYTTVTINLKDTRCSVRKFLVWDEKKKWATEHIYFQYPDSPNEEQRTYRNLGSADATMKELERLHAKLKPLVKKLMTQQ